MSSPCLCLPLQPKQMNLAGRVAGLEKPSPTGEVLTGTEPLTLLKAATLDNSAKPQRRCKEGTCNQVSTTQGTIDKICKICRLSITIKMSKLSIHLQKLINILEAFEKLQTQIEFIDESELIGSEQDEFEVSYFSTISKAQAYLNKTTSCTKEASLLVAPTLAAVKLPTLNYLYAKAVMRIGYLSK
ncbi:hypothetical protein PR048_026492 [Dryococelus australis]|uniref:Uncharacterized protein n=1 Tax=Dryococelus australis TaxID=614101 RepID=A0ABQ9GLH2_9NEOP|nr:hypothetical protein PR048_026492 [Dryococelus australis]